MSAHPDPSSARTGGAIGIRREALKKIKTQYCGGISSIGSDGGVDEGLARSRDRGDFVRGNDSKVRVSDWAGEHRYWVGIERIMKKWAYVE